MAGYSEKKVVLVTGGAGSIGTALVKRLLAEERETTVRVFDNNEYGLFQLKRELGFDYRVRYLLGDIKDEQRVDFAMRGVNVVYHLAAVKNLEISEYNAPETIRVNIMGTLHLVERALLTSNTVEKFVYVSTDKAAYPSNLYGTTKLIGEHLTTWANKVGAPQTRFSSVRFGNVIESRGNCFDIWRIQQSKGEPLTLTSPAMKRYFWHVDHAAKFVHWVGKTMEGGELFIPKMGEMRNVLEVMQEIFGSGAKYVLTGPRTGEKTIEELMSLEEREGAVENEYGWVIKAR